MPEGSRTNRKAPEAEERYAALCEAVFPIESRDMTTGERADYLIERIEKLSEAVGTKRKLSELGVKLEDLSSLLADKTLLDASLRHNIYKPDKEEIETIFRSLM